MEPSSLASNSRAVCAVRQAFQKGVLNLPNSRAKLDRVPILHYFHIERSSFMGIIGNALKRLRIRRTVRRVLSKVLDDEYRRLLLGPKPQDCICLMGKPNPRCPWHNREQDPRLD